MERSGKLTFILGFLYLSFLGHWALAAEDQEALPNIIVFLADDLGFGDLGCYGHPFIETPNLDRLAAEGLRLTDCHSGAAICSPSRGAILTGRTPSRLGIYSLCNSFIHLRDEEITIPELLKPAGYSTWFAGKWHLGLLTGGKHPDPGDHGFDRWYAGGNGKPTTWRPENFVEGGHPVTPPPDGYFCDIIVEKGIEWIKQRDPEKPFFLELCSSEPHEPVTPAPEYADKYDNDRIRKMEPQVRRGGMPFPPWQLDRLDLSKHYYGIVTQLDNAVGILMEALSDMDLAENTLIFFTSDNGPEYHEWIFPNRRTYGASGGYRGGKRFLYEGGIRVPGIVRWPARIEAGRVSDELVSSVDLLPTVCELAGVEVPKDRVIDGTSLLPLFDGKSVERESPLLWHATRTDIPQYSMRLGDEALVAYIKKPEAGLSRGEWIRTANIQHVEYYDLSIDPYQEVELSEHRPERFAELRTTFLGSIEKLRGDMHDWGAQAPLQKPVSAMLNWEKAKWNHQMKSEPVFDEKLRPPRTYPPYGYESEK